jgi:predicted DNA-binding transcriptional regulator AlpA
VKNRPADSAPAAAVNGASAPPAGAPDSTDPLWTVNDVCRFLGVSRRWVHERTRLREIPCYRWRHVLRFDPKEIRLWMAKHHDSPEANAGTRTGGSQ